MKIKNDIKWLKEKGFITEVNTPGALTTKSQLNKYVGQIAPSSDIFDSKIKPLGEYLTFEFLENGSFSFSKDGLSYSLDNGTSWNTLSANTNITVSNGDKVLFKGEYTNTTAFIGQFKMTSKFNISGNIMSLLFGDKFIGETDLTRYNSAFDHLFEGTAVVDASKLVLPATKLSTYCYGRMFYNCSSLTTAPELPATELTTNCYNSMFYGCTSLTAAPELPATTLASSCYSGMFSGCTSLTTAPVLPATTLADSCYSDMFRNCSSLTTAPELPATELAQYCYSGMFLGCSSLTAAPELPATTLADSCYSNMFGGCSSLTTAPELPAVELKGYCYNGMFNSCTSLTTAPELPATTLAASCYYSMFRNCSSLTTAPQVLPATELEYMCYHGMFWNCSSLTTAPELPAATLTSSCYSNMFYNCSKLNYIKAMFVTIPSSLYSTSNWVDGVSRNGTFVKNAAATWDVTGGSGIPTGWTVETATA